MKNFLFVIFTTLALSGCRTALSGCRTYVIDSNPQGLRVTINDIERGVTPLEYTTSEHFVVDMVAPTRNQLINYEDEKGKLVSLWTSGSQSKSIWPDNSPSGTIFFQFIQSEYDRPTTEEDRQKVLHYMNEDADNLKRRQELLKKD